MFNDEELQDEINEIFSDTQEVYRRAVAIGELYVHQDNIGAYFTQRKMVGYHYVRTMKKGGRARRTPEYMERRRAYTEKSDLDDIRRRLLAGERPAVAPGKRGRRPQRWIDVAKDLGIDLGYPPPKRIRRKKTPPVGQPTLGGASVASNAAPQ